MNKSFFSEWKDTKKMTQFGSFITMMILLLVLWITANITEFASQGLFLTILLVSFMLVVIVDFVDEKIPILGASHFGLNFAHAGKAFIIGIILGTIVAGGLFVISPPFAIAGGATAPIVSFIFIVILAPYIEEVFFRSALFFTSQQNSEAFFSKQNAMIFSFVLTCVMFGIFHFFVYGANIYYMFLAMIMSGVYLTGNAYFKNISFSIGMHMANNFIAFGGLSALLLMVV